jgi:hypothetical protein
LYFAWIFLISGCTRCIAIIERACLAVSGKRASITVQVRRMMQIPRLGMNE